MKYIRSILAFSVLLAFAFATPKSYADDPCIPLSTGPHLYQINRTATQATLFFSPISTDQVQSYTIMYGYHAEDQRFSITVPQGPSTGAVTVTINDLEPGVQYFYKVSGNTSCLNSPWSSWEGDKPVGAKGTSTAVPGIPVAGAETLYIWSAVCAMMLIGGFGLFAYSRRKV